MCDLAWVVLSDRVRTVALSDRGAYLMAGEPPPDPEGRVADFYETVCAAPSNDRLTPAQRRLWRIIRARR